MIIKLSQEKDKKGNLDSNKREATHHVQVILNKSQSLFLIRTMKDRKQWDDIFKAMKAKQKTKNKSVKKRFYIQHNCPSKMKKKLRYSYINKHRENL